MSDVTIHVQDLWKRYRIGLKKSTSLRESIMRFFQREDENQFWALKDVNLKVMKGEAIGIIGQNGAGKSTLLKILSKITYPTRGRLEINGRISSLLEVGTGFHPELTGRENTFLNGTILGMSRKEISKKFHEIVAFSGVEKFIDTPVKHYSSGMKVRLAFSVAAHLEPEILIIDEVLAVGDSTFQKRCLEKMLEATRSGITVLFVSHNMEAIRNLCSKCCLMNMGSIDVIDKTDFVIEKYVSKDQSLEKEYDLLRIENRTGRGKLIFSKICLNSAELFPSQSFEVSFKLRSIELTVYRDLLFGLNIYNSLGTTVFHMSNFFLGIEDVTHEDDNITYSFRLDMNRLKPGLYTFSLFLRANEEVQDWVSNAGSFLVKEGNVYSFSNSKMIQGVVQPSFTFSYE